MAYWQFTLSDIKSKLHLAVELATDVFVAVPPQDLSPLLTETLQENVPLARAIQFSVRGAVPPFAKGGEGGFICQGRREIPPPPLRKGERKDN